ncbi:hypothetical protein SVIOM74S_01189 [Streptomyces violarus]
MEMAGTRDAPTAAVVVDPDGVVSGWSEGGRLLLGWTAEDTVGRPVADLLVDPPPDGFPEDYGAGPDPTGFIPLRHRDGSTVDAVVAAHPLSGPDGRALGHVVTIQRWGRRPVIADRAFEQCPFALGAYDPDLRFLWINASSARVIAHSEEQVLGKTSLICEVSDASNTAPHLRRARAFDEGGRGLLLVAQLTQGWGTRHTTSGKTIWCAQTLP